MVVISEKKKKKCKTLGKNTSSLRCTPDAFTKCQSCLANLVTLNKEHLEKKASKRHSGLCLAGGQPGPVNE